MELLHLVLREYFQRVLPPSSNLALHEMMVRFGGRSKHTYWMPKKPITEGYSILALCWTGYTWNLLYSSCISGIQVLEQAPYHGSIHLTPTLIEIHQTVQSLPPYPTHQFNIFIDNYFTNINLFQVLRQLGIDTCGTAQQNQNAFPPDLHNSFPGLS